MSFCVILYCRRNDKKEVECTSYTVSTRKSPDDVYVTKWIWYEKLMFLWDVIGPKKTVSNLPLVCK